MDWPRRERATTAIPAPAILSPAVAHCRITGEVLMSPAARGPGQHRPGAAQVLRETVGRGLRRGQGTTHRCGPTAFYAHVPLPPAGKWMSASLSPSASAPACGLIEARRRTGLPFPTTAPPMSPRTYTPVPDLKLSEAGAGADRLPGNFGDGVAVRWGHQLDLGARDSYGKSLTVDGVRWNWRSIPSPLHAELQRADQ